jgi:ribonuclease P protein component
LRRNSFAKADRILKRSRFIELSKRGKRLNNRYFIVIYAENFIQNCRLGITVSKKVGTAAKRNKIKRFSREFFRLNRHCIQGSWDINLIAKREILSIEHFQVCKVLNELFNKISNDYKI